jgi:hypothetical protein
MQVKDTTIANLTQSVNKKDAIIQRKHQLRDTRWYCE